MVSGDAVGLLERYKAIGDEIQRLEDERSDVHLRLHRLLMEPTTARLIVSAGDLWPAIRDALYEGREDMKAAAQRVLDAVVAGTYYGEATS